MDLQMPGLNGIEAIIRIQSEFPNARIIVLTTYTGDAQVVRALKAGARAYLLKRQVHRELLETIRAVHAGQRRIPSEMAAELVDHLPGVWQRVPLGEREGLQRLEPVREPYLRVYPQHLVRMLLRPGYIEEGRRRSAMRRVTYSGGEVGLCCRHMEQWLGKAQTYTF